MTVKEAIANGCIQRIDGTWYADFQGDTPYKTAACALLGYVEGRTRADEQERERANHAWLSSSFRAVRDHDAMKLYYPDGTKETLPLRQFRQRICDMEDVHGACAVIPRADYDALKAQGRILGND